MKRSPRFSKKAPATRRRFWKFCYAVLFILLAFQAQAQTDVLHLLGQGQLRAPPPQHFTKVPAGHATLGLAPQANLGSFVLREVIIEGTSSASAIALRQAAAPAIGHQVNSADISLIAQRIGLAEQNAGIVLYSVSLPAQKIRLGVLRLRIAEGSVVHVQIQGAANGRRLQLIRGYAQNILNSRPLRRRVLERNILLMGDIAGTKIGSRFIPDPTQPADVTLLLALQQTRVFGGFSVDNQGSPLLYNTQAVFNTGINDLFHEGERTQLVLGLPLDVTRYQFYGINDIEPVGTNGLTLSFNAGELVSHPQGDDVLSGTAAFASAELDDPVIRSVHQNITLGGGFTYLNSSDAFLGFTTSDERTRSVQGSITYNDDRYFNGVNRVSASVSQGLDFLGARMAGPAYGGPSFTKENIKLDRLQLLPGSFILRLSLAGQTTTDRLPPSQAFEYGGADYGLGFYAAELAGDEGIAGLGELSRAIPAQYLPPMLGGSGVFTSLDYGRIWNRQPIYVPPTDRGASFAAGLRLMLLHKVQVQIAGARSIITPEYAPNNQRWRFVIGTTGQF
jgi:hemolysin activation/secretion protein